MKAELKTKIADILAKNYLLPIDSMDSIAKCNTWCDNVAKEIVKLVEQPQIELPSDNTENIIFKMLKEATNLPNWEIRPVSIKIAKLFKQQMK